MKYRRLINGEPSFGQGQQDFVTDNDAVAQAILTRLQLYISEWWEDINDGLPLWTQIMGYNGANKAHVDAVIKQRISDTKLVDTPLVKNVSGTFGMYLQDTRDYSFVCNVQTIYGTVQITNSR